ncbi:hypothetical protein BSU00_12625 [Tenacibaculum sp. SG-28]|nr:hypothetical protein BSU00_12625 [Tenacibaculum sp. SG-28]
MRVLVFNFASTHQTENPCGFLEVDENKQLLIAIVVTSILFSSQFGFDFPHLFNEFHLRNSIRSFEFRVYSFS